MAITIKSLEPTPTRLYHINEQLPDHIIRRPGYNLCEQHQQEYLQYCSCCALKNIAIDPFNGQDTITFSKEQSR